MYQNDRSQHRAAQKPKLAQKSSHVPSIASCCPPLIRLLRVIPVSTFSMSVIRSATRTLIEATMVSGASRTSATTRPMLRLRSYIGDQVTCLCFPPEPASSLLSDTCMISYVFNVSARCLSDLIRRAHSMNGAGDLNAAHSRTPRIPFWLDLTAWPKQTLENG